MRTTLHGVLKPHAIQTPTDPFFSDVVLLAHFDGVNGQGGPFLDNSLHNHLMGAGNGAALSTTAPKFGTASLYTGPLAADKFVQVQGDQADWGYIGLAYTIEFWMKTIDNQPGGLLSTWTANATGGWKVVRTGDATIQWTTKINALFSGVIPNLNDGNWHHVAITDDTVNAKLWGDGNLIVSAGNGGNVAATNVDLFIGSLDGQQYWPGYLDDVRITRGVARYTSNFVPPTRPFPNS
jgi:hypothetical protein